MRSSFVSLACSVLLALAALGALAGAQARPTHGAADGSLFAPPVQQECGGWATYCTAKVNSLGCTPAIGMTGVPSLFGSGVCRLTTLALRGKSVGLYLHSLIGAQAKVFHGGWLCIRTPFKRHAALATGGTSGLCDGALTEDFNAYVQSGAEPNFSPGAPIWIQCWSRDAGDPFGDSLSQGLQTSMCP